MVAAKKEDFFTAENAEKRRERPNLGALGVLGGSFFLFSSGPPTKKIRSRTLPFFLNVALFGMSLQEAIDAPTVHTLHAPSSFYPRTARPLAVSAEGRISPATIEELRRRGHQLTIPRDWAHGRVQAVALGRDGLAGAASPRRGTAYVVGW